MILFSKLNTLDDLFVSISCKHGRWVCVYFHKSKLHWDAGFLPKTYMEYCNKNNE